EDRLVEVVAALLTRLRVAIGARRREDPLPGPLPGGVGELDPEGAREIDVARSRPQVCLVLRPHGAQVPLQGRPDLLGEDRYTILAAFGVADNDLARFEVDVLHPQPRTFHQA